MYYKSLGRIQLYTTGGRESLFSKSKFKQLALQIEKKERAKISKISRTKKGSKPKMSKMARLNEDDTVEFLLPESPQPTKNEVSYQRTCKRIRYSIGEYLEFSFFR